VSCKGTGDVEESLPFGVGGAIPIGLDDGRTGAFATGVGFGAVNHSHQLFDIMPVCQIIRRVTVIAPSKLTARRLHVFLAARRWF